MFFFAHIKHVCLLINSLSLPVAAECLVGTFLLAYIILIHQLKKQDVCNVVQTEFFMDYKNEYFCDAPCQVGVPCQYQDEVDFRIIVMTFNRNDSLQKCLLAISRVDTMDKRVAVDIWVDRSRGDEEKKLSPEIHLPTLLVAQEFQRGWKKGRVCIHEREANAYIDGQWIDTWRPRENTKEIVLILEDDVDVSPQVLRWLEAVHGQYDRQEDIAGYTLQMEGTRFFKGKKGQLKGPKDDNVFLYGVLGTWGFSPQAKSWAKFQDWYHSKNSTLKPYVPDIVPTRWFKNFEKKGTERSMWEMWHIYFSYVNNLYTVYCNLHVKYDNNTILLSHNRKEQGLHFGRKRKVSNVRWDLLMSKWLPEYAAFPVKEVRYSHEGNVLESGIDNGR